MTVYVVTSGEYSSYGIRAMFSSKEKAERYVKEFRRADDWEGHSIAVEQWKVDEDNDVVAITRGRCYMDATSGFCEHDEMAGIHRPSDPPEVMVSPCAGRPHIIVLSVDGIAHAHKVAVERRQEWLAKRASA